MDISSNDWAMRAAAFAQIRRFQIVSDQLTSADLAAGFKFAGERVPLVNPQRGIFKPRQMEALLSIRTVFPRSGAKVWYDDQTKVHQQIYEGEETVDYAFMGTDPEAADNRWLREAMERQVPVIYFLGVSPGRYNAVFPSFIVGWDGNAAKAQVAFSVPEVKSLPKPPSDAVERRYALRLVKQRLHQASFREAVMTAYKGRCAITGMPEAMLLDAAHIIGDADEDFGQPVVSNGLPLSKIHHAAFDAHLIGIDPNFQVHVSHRLLEQHDGPLLESMKRLHLGQLLLPERAKDRPDRERLEARFAQFKLAA
jgi:putative restriction endonuclease